MGGIESKCGTLLHGLLMPKVADADYAGSRRITSFPDPPVGSLLLLSSIALRVAPGAVEASRSFLVAGLGGRCVEAADGLLSISIGATQLRLDGSASGRPGLAEVWPGHFYLWVEDSVQTHDQCEKLEKTLGGDIIKEVHRIKDEYGVDAMVLQQPVGNNTFIINPAPVGGMADNMRSVLPARADAAGVGGGVGGGGNALGVIDMMHLVPPGASDAVARFYEHFLGAAMTKKNEGWALHFSLGPALHQTMTFIEDESLVAAVGAGGETQHGETKHGLEDSPEVCMYVLSKSHLNAAFRRCSQAGLVDSQVIWEDVDAACEFRFSRCIDPKNLDNVVLQLQHIIRSPDHKEWPLPPEAITRASAGYSAPFQELPFEAGSSHKRFLDKLFEK